MRKSKLFGWIILLVISGLVKSCATIYATANTNSWIEYELPPSKIVKTGAAFFEGTLSDNSKFSVHYDETVDTDAEYYYTMLMQDWGWRRNGDTWSAPQGSRNVKRGYIYVNPRRKVAVYFYPVKQFNVFKVVI